MNHALHFFRRGIFLFVASVFILCPSFLLADGYNLNQTAGSGFNYQAVFSDSNGDPLSGEYTFKFELITSPEDVDYLWQEIHTVSVVDGKVNIYLGELSPIAESIVDQANYLRIYINDEALDPPTKLSAIPSSMVANTAKSLSGDVKTEGASLYLPGATSIPKSVELSRSGDDGKLSIWGAGGTGIPQVEMLGTSSGGNIVMYPGHDWITGPDKAMDLSVGSEGGVLGIWGTDGTALPQLELKGTSTGGSLTMYPGHDWITGSTKALDFSVNSSGGTIGIWGTNGTGIPQVEMLGSSYGGNIVMYPGHDWIAGPTKAMDLSVDAEGGILGIWGTDGTAIPQIEMKGSSTGGILTMYPGHDWLSGSIKAIELSVISTGSQIGIWGTNGTSYPQIDMQATLDGGLLKVVGGAGTTPERVEIRSSDGTSIVGLYSSHHTLTQPKVGMAGDSGGGLIVLRDDTNDSQILLDGAGAGDASVNIPDNAINSLEILNEVGMAQGRYSSCMTIDTLTMQDVATVSITIPADGYIFVIGSGMVEVNGTTSGNRVDVQIDETSGGSKNLGRFSRIGLGSYVGTSYSSFDFSVNRTYFKTAGTYTFRLEAAKVFLNGTATVCFANVTALYIPTSYGTVSTIAEGTGEDYSLTGDQSVSDMEVQTVDLRDLEIRAREAQQKALELELELANARLNK